MNIDLWGWEKNVTHALIYFHLMKKKINQLTLVPQPNNHDKRFKKNVMITNNQVVNV